uniref:Serine hydrolase like n=1 Tax=Scophthalmus maximus TaxID=52904 RepID=A0A8D3AS95_SCOMX
CIEQDLKLQFETKSTWSRAELSVPVPWGEIRGKVWGPDHGRPVLCLHGWADNCGSFDTLIPLLPRECRYVAVDLAGHGRSSHRPAGVLYSALAYVADVHRVVDALHLKKFSIISHSMGECSTGIDCFSALYPEMVDALVFLDSYGFLPTDTVQFTHLRLRNSLQSLNEKKRRVYTYKEAVERLLAANPTLSEQSVHILFERGLVEVEGGFVFSRDLRVNFVINIPVFLSLSLSQHKVVTLPGNHHIHLTNPEVIAPLVTDYLRTEASSLSTKREHKL